MVTNPNKILVISIVPSYQIHQIFYDVIMSIILLEKSHIIESSVTGKRPLTPLRSFCIQFLHLLLKS